MPAISPNAISYSVRCRQHAANTPERIAVIAVTEDGDEARITYRDLDERVETAAATLRAVGAGPQSLIVISLPSSPEHLIAALAAWRLGACVLPLNPEMPPLEREKMLELAGSWRPLLTVASWHVPSVPSVTVEALSAKHATTPTLCDAIPCPGKAIGSGGSTGRPKIIVDPKPWAHVPGLWGALTRAGLRAHQTQLIAGALHHNVGFFLSHIGLFEGHTLILPRRFNSIQAVDLIERHRVQFAGLLPIMMQRMAKLPGIEQRDFSSVEGIYHSGGACPDWVKRVWLRLIPPARLWELYGGTEDIGIVMADGEQWLARPGTLGRPFLTDVAVLDAEGKPVPCNEIGEIHMRSDVPPGTLFGEHWPMEPGFEYVGARKSAPKAGGYRSIGDLGWLDADGFLFLADRRVDMIKSGGINIYPAEVEAALSEHPAIADAVVISVPDPEWGQRVHALIQPAAWPSTITADALNSFCRERLSKYKIPKSYELCKQLPRDSSGKIRRSALREERSNGVFSGQVLQACTTASETDNQTSAGAAD